MKELHERVFFIGCLHRRPTDVRGRGTGPTTIRPRHHGGTLDRRQTLHITRRVAMSWHNADMSQVRETHQLAKVFEAPEEMRDDPQEGHPTTRPPRELLHEDLISDAGHHEATAQSVAVSRIPVRGPGSGSRLVSCRFHDRRYAGDVLQKILGDVVTELEILRRVV
jgi:hypothetical protein